ncbi:MAG TPA: GntR family transcriptional regulator [Candidatus Dormibacteraeota bacterium]|nr:GntR family transcriptional regulator [Candidatus Dormibacteraeota bacterium]
MDIIINESSEKPIYHQIQSQIRAHILSEKLKPDDHLPSIRFLAKELGVSVITTKRAYEELEQEELIYTTKGKGTFVKSHDRKKLIHKNYEFVEAKVIQLLKEAEDLGISKMDMESIINRALKEVESFYE